MSNGNGNGEKGRRSPFSKGTQHETDFMKNYTVKGNGTGKEIPETNVNPSTQDLSKNSLVQKLQKQVTEFAIKSRNK